MNSTFLVVAIILGIIGLIILYKWLKPYIMKYDTTILLTGGLGSGKTLESVKKAIILIRKNRFYKYAVPNFFTKIRNRFARWHNNRQCKKEQRLASKKIVYDPKIWSIKELRKKPMLYSNLPIYYKTKALSRKREWSIMLEEKHMLLIKHMTEYSVVLIDEMPQFVNQFQWNEQLVQDNLNEFITFFRHYIGGYLIINAQSESEIEVHFRRKLNQAIWCYDFKKRLFGLFYTNRMCDIMLSENISTMSTTYVEDNTKLHFGLFPPRKTYDTRAYSVRYENTYEEDKPRKKWKNLKTYKVLRMKDYTSPLDLETTDKQKLDMKQKAEKMSRKADKDDVRKEKA